LTTKAEGEKVREITTVEGLRNKGWRELERVKARLERAVEGG